MEKAGIFKLENENGIDIVTITVGTITHEDNLELKRAFTELLDRGSKNIVLDLSSTTYVSSVVLASLVFMQKVLKDSSGNFVICGIYGNVKEILEVTNLDKVLDIVNDRQQAVSKIIKKK